MNITDYIDQWLKDIDNKDMVSKCPLCGKKALFWNKYDCIYECLACKKNFDHESLRSAIMGTKYTGYMDDGGW